MARKTIKELKQRRAAHKDHTSKYYYSKYPHPRTREVTERMTDESRRSAVLQKAHYAQQHREASHAMGVLATETEAASTQFYESRDERDIGVIASRTNPGIHEDVVLPATSRMLSSSRKISSNLSAKFPSQRRRAVGSSIMLSDADSILKSNRARHKTERARTQQIIAHNARIRAIPFALHRNRFGDMEARPTR